MKTIAILTFLSFVGISSSKTAFADCPQTRKTLSAPSKFLMRANPLPIDELNIEAGRKLYNQEAKPITCKTCHGIKGNGMGDTDFESTPPARNFTCTKMMNKIPDGQLFWIIKNGSKNTSMFAFSDLSDKQVWQLIHYIRRFSK